MPPIAPTRSRFLSTLRAARFARSPIRHLAGVVTVVVTLAAFDLPPAAGQEPAWLATIGGYGSTTGRFAYPHHMAISPATGNLYVGDLLNHRVQVLTSTGAFVRQWPLSNADGIAVGRQDTVYALSMHQVFKFTSTGTLVTSWGGFGTGDGQFNYAMDVGVDSQGYVYVIDGQNRRVQKFNAAGTFLTKWGSQGSGPGQFEGPFGLYVDADDDIWVSDGWNHTVQEFDSNGLRLSGFGTQGTGPGQWDSPGRLCIDGDGRVLVPDAGNGRVQAYTQQGQFLLQWGAPGANAAQFNHPLAVSTDGAGTVYVLDKDNHRIQKFASVATPARKTSWGALKSSFR